MAVKPRNTQYVSITRALKIAAADYENALVRTYGERYRFRAYTSELDRLQLLGNAVIERQLFVARQYAIAEMLAQ